MLGTMHHMQPLVAAIQACSRTTACLQVKSVTPVGDRVFVKAEEAEAKTVGGILLPTSAQKRPTQGTVTSAGSAKAVKVGAAPRSAASPRLFRSPVLTLPSLFCRLATRWCTASMRAPRWSCRATTMCCSRCACGGETASGAGSFWSGGWRGGAQGMQRALAVLPPCLWCS